MSRDALKKCLLGFVVVTQALPMQCFAGDPPTKIARLFPWTTRDHGKRPHTAQDPCIEDLAKNIDWLENRLNLYGTVVAKSPDVWGEARLTAHRQEFEDVLKSELRLFNKNQLNGAEFVNDQAFLAFAMAMKGPTVTGGVSPPTASVTATTSGAATSTATGADAAAVNLSTNFTGPGTLFGKTADGASILGSMRIEVEQTEVLDQLARYVNHLHSIRRINEGDDTSDSPGYAMNLVRVPVSILPGHHTKIGYGAEITMTATPYHGPELLPVAFRDLVINDLIDQLAIPIARFINADPQSVEDLFEAYNTYQQSPLTFERWNEEMLRTNLPPGIGNELSSAEFAAAVKGFPGGTFFSNTGLWKGLQVSSINTNLFRKDLQGLRDAVSSNRANLEEEYNFLAPLTGGVYSEIGAKNSSTKRTTPLTQMSTYSLQAIENRMLTQQSDSLDAKKQTALRNASRLLKTQIDVENAIAMMSASINSVGEIQEAVRELGQVIDHLPAGTTRRSTLPFPPTQLLCNYGMAELANFTASLHGALRADVINREVVHVTDIQAYLREELGAAYELLRQDAMFHWWEEAATGQSTLVQDIRLRRTDSVAETRQRFFQEIYGTTDVNLCSLDRSSGVMAWCIYVESLLLNERLVQDIRETMGNKPNGFNCTQWLPYFGPNPPDDARLAFNEYVRIRWPIRVFALDPQINEQNVADVRSLYRQMQMAIALSFSTGDIGLSAALQSMRKLQRDRATVDLNRTAIGFGHGDDTFGWRFYPRFQTPPVEGNATVFFRDLIVGGPTDKQLEAAKEIEPGMRECTAVVLMPSFVPHVTFTTRSNWFKLGKQGITADSIEDTVTYSRAIKQMETQANECVRCSHLYRDGEVDRLLARVHQLDKKLPLQSLECPVPIENSLGGFEIFSSGTRELAPELNGWYGSPGYDPVRGGQMFFAGDSFSVPSSRLIVGNQPIPFRMLSRQIIEVTLPPGLSVVRDRKLDEFASETYSGYLDAHIATPYGVSGHMLIPVLRQSTAAVVTPTLTPTKVQIRAVRKQTNNVPAAEIEKFILPTSLSLFDVSVPSGGGLEGNQMNVRLITTSGSDRLADVGGQNGIILPASQSSNRFVMTANTISDQFRSPDAAKISTHLGSALKDHLDYILRNNNNTPTSMSYDIRMVLLNGTNPAALTSGSVNIVVSIE